MDELTELQKEFFKIETGLNFDECDSIWVVNVKRESILKAKAAASLCREKRVEAIKETLKLCGDRFNSGLSEQEILEKLKL